MPFFCSDAVRYGGRHSACAPVSWILAAALVGCGGGDEAPASAESTRVAEAGVSVHGAAPAEPGASTTERLQAHAAGDARVAPAAFSNFEAPQVHPLDITPGGQRLLAVNTANGTLEVYDIRGSQMARVAVVKVGMDPVSVRALSDTEAWVVNHSSDSVSIVDLVKMQVRSTVAVDDEPADVVFAGAPQRAYVSCAQAQSLLVFDPQAPAAPLLRIPIEGEQPRALATSPDRRTVYLGIFESGNGTTALSAKTNTQESPVVRDPRGPYGGVNPPPNAANATRFEPPLNPANPAPSNTTSLIVRRTAGGDWLDDNGRNWRGFVNGTATLTTRRGVNRVPGWDLVDRDVAVVDTASGAVSYRGQMMNIVMALGVNPVNGRVALVGTEATNEVRFEPRLQGKFLRVLLGSFDAGQVGTARDLNAHLDYRSASVPMAERLQSLGDPRGIAWSADGTRAYVTGMGSNNLVVLDASGARARPAPIPVGQGPTGVVLQQALGHQRAFVLNRFDASITVVELATQQVSATVALAYDPTPQVVRDGRPLLYDTVRGSGTGHIACASCHVDARTDRLAWDLGDPAGSMLGAGGVQHHPMKGPLLTTTLVDTMQSAFLHWRGDAPDLSHFANAFVKLQGADAAITSAEVDSLRAFLATLRTPPNPYRNLDNTFPTRVAMPGPRGQTLRVGNALAGRSQFEANCRSCHPGHTGRGASFLERPAFSGGQFLNPPRWQNFYRRDGLWFGDAAGSTAGFGFQQDGSFDSTHNHTRSDDLMAFMYAFNGSFPGTPAGLNATNVAVDAHAAVGRQVTLHASEPGSALFDSLLGIARSGAVGMVAHGCVDGRRRGYRFVAPDRFDADDGSATTLAQLLGLALQGQPVTLMAVRQGTQQAVAEVRLTESERVCESVPPAPGNLLLNPHFEVAGLLPGQWRHVAVVPGWASSGTVEVWNQLEGFAGPGGIATWIELDVGSRIDSVSQTVATPAGAALELSFWYSARPRIGAFSNQFEVLWNGQRIGLLAPDGAALAVPQWQRFSARVTATGQDTLGLRETGANDTTGALLTGMSLVVLP